MTFLTLSILFLLSLLNRAGADIALNLLHIRVVRPRFLSTFQGMGVLLGELIGLPLGGFDVVHT